MPIIPANDSRLVEVFVTPYGAVNEAGVPTGGLKAAPIQAFATFYVTGFPGDKCNSKEPADNEVESFEIVGHFIKYINNVPTGTGSGKCEENTFGSCIAVLTK